MSHYTPIVGFSYHRGLVASLALAFLGAIVTAAGLR